MSASSKKITTHFDSLARNEATHFVAGCSGGDVIGADRTRLLTGEAHGGDTNTLLRMAGETVRAVSLLASQIGQVS